tara:strand:- start:3812 stop:4006 length:195 start_codon:yes stop_codon:yes gene_type:complete
MGNDTTSTKTTPTAAVVGKASGNTIDAASFRQMVDILDNLRDHTHTFTDDYTSNCQCNCSRGSL